jgi:hypothetical protein
VDSFAEYLRPFLPYLPPDLVSAQCSDEILSVTRHLPGALGIGPFMFECGLDDRPVADFSVAVMASRGDHAELSRLGATDTPSSALDGAGWTPIHRFARAWADPSSPLGRTVEEVWLEFDVCLTGDAPRSIPSVFFGLGYRSPPEPRLRWLLADEYVRAAEECLTVLAGGPVRAATVSRLAKCCHVLPASSQILFLGAMTSRGTEAIRVVVSGSSLEDMVRYVERVGPRQPMGNLALMADISALTDHLWLAMDVEDAGVAPRIGFDCYCNGIDRAPDTTRWADLLDVLVDKGMCTDRKRAALLAAADMSSRTLHEPTWPESLRRISTILGPTGFDRIGLRIHHVKVIDRPGMPLEAKAYLCGTVR